MVFSNLFTNRTAYKLIKSESAAKRKIGIRCKLAAYEVAERFRNFSDLYLKKKEEFLIVMLAMLGPRFAICGHSFNRALKLKYLVWGAYKPLR